MYRTFRKELQGLCVPIGGPAVSVLLLAGFTFLASFAMFSTSYGAENGRPPAPVLVEEVALRALAPVSTYSGTIISRNRARVSAEVSGRLVWVAEVGDKVVEGDVIARLEDTLLEQQLIENQAMVEKEKYRLEFYVKEVDRLQRLATKNNAAQSRIDQAVADKAATRSELAANRSRVSQSRYRLKHTELRAPFNGVVTERLLQMGEWVDVGDAVVSVVDEQNLEVQVWVPAGTLGFVKSGTRLAMHNGQGENATSSTEGTVRIVVPVGDERSRLYEVRISELQGLWHVGQSVRVVVPQANPRTVVAVPRDALVFRHNSISVFRVMEGNVAERVEVLTGVAAGNFMEIAGDSIQAGDRVVVRGAERLRSGQTVAIIEDGPSP